MPWTDEGGRVFLLELADLLEQKGIPFFLMQGTALGAYRDHGFTPTEADIDLGILQEDLAFVARELVDDLMRNECQVETFLWPFRQIRTIVAWKHGVKADLVGWIRWQDKRFTSSPRHPNVPEPYSIVHEAAILENYQQVEVFGRVFNVPSPIETYLEREYGGEWRVPKPDPISRTRVYHFIADNRIPNDYLLSQP